MKIDIELTKVKFEASCVSPARLARKMGLSRAMVTDVVNGTYKSPGSKGALRVYEELRKMDVLVEVPDDSEQAA
jgi:hypothetical protein